MPNSHIVIGLAYGDEGKGSWVEHLVRKHKIAYVARFNGGVQAHHHVVREDGSYHGFRQFAAGSFVPGVQTLLSRFMLLEPEMLFEEARALASMGVDSPLERVIVSEETPVITPFARLLNQIQEAYRGRSRHGSTGFGIGITQRDLEQYPEQALRVRDFSSPRLFEKLRVLAEAAIEEAEEYRSDDTLELFERLERSDLNHYAEFYRRFPQKVRVLSDKAMLQIFRENDVVFEGAQGVLLDQQFGFFPHVTRSNCTFGNAEQLLREANFDGKLNRVGLLRGYGTRHGAGPFVTEVPGLDIEPCHNGTNLWQGSFRQGWFDAVSARYALKVVGGVDTLALTNLDRMSHLSKIKIAINYSDIDSRYFENERTFRVLREDVTTLANRCHALERVKANYREVPGWKENESGIEGYLDELGKELGRRVDAFSTSALHHKSYR